MELKFFGFELGEDQLDSLSDFVEMMKKRFKRKAETVAVRPMQFYGGGEAVPIPGKE